MSWRPSDPSRPQFYAWVLLNGLILRPLLTRLNWDTRHLWGCDFMSSPANTTGLEVIVVGVSRTGTHSVNMALEMFGLRTYGVFESIHYLPDFFNKRYLPNDLAYQLRSCGVKAFLTEPHYDLIGKLMPVSPDVRVILTTRAYDSWREASKWGRWPRWGYYINFAAFTARVVIHLGCDWVPYAPVYHYFAERGASMENSRFTTLLLEHCGMARWGTFFQNLRPEWNTVFEHNASAYHEYHESIRFFVPPEQLLELDFKRHGWAELSSFLGRPQPSTGPLPRTGSRSSYFAAFRLQSHPVRVVVFYAFLASSVLANWLAFCLLWTLLAPCRASVGSCCRAGGGLHGGSENPKEE